MTIAWTVDQIKVRGGAAYFAFTKIGKYLLGPPESLWVLRSANILNVTDAAEISSHAKRNENSNLLSTP